TAVPVIVAPIAGVLADRFGNRPFMLLGLGLQAAGLAWVALIVEPGMGYAELCVALVVAGAGISMCWPTVANAVVGSVPPAEIGVASGANSALRELGGVFGVAVLAAIFSRQHGVYSDPQSFVDGFRPALAVGAGFSGVGMLAAALSPRLRRPAQV